MNEDDQVGNEMNARTTYTAQPNISIEMPFHFLHRLTLVVVSVHAEITFTEIEVRTYVTPLADTISQGPTIEEHNEKSKPVDSN